MPKKVIRVDHPPATPEEIARQVEDRRRRDRVDQLEQGFTFRPDGRHGYIYYRNGIRLIELIWEMSGPESHDIILYLDGLQKWVAPTEELIDPEKQREIEAALRAWLSENRIRAIVEGASK